MEPSTPARKIDGLLRDFVRQTQAMTRGDPAFAHGPTVLEYAFTSACNLRCPMCSQAENPPVARAPREAAARFLDDVLRTVTIWVPSATSEPLLNDVDLMIDHCRRHRVFLDIITNVTLLTPATLDRLLPYLHGLTLSLDSSVPEVFEDVRRPAKWVKTLPNIEYAMRRTAAEQIPCTVHAVLMAETAPHLPALVDFVADHGGFELTVLEQLPNTTDATVHAVSRLGDTAVDGILAEVRRRAEHRRVNLSLRISSPHGGRYQVVDPPKRIDESAVIEALQAKLAIEVAGYCPQVGHYLKVEPDGEAFPCCRGPRELRLGNVYQDGFEAVWNGEAAQRLRAAMASGDVPECCRTCLVREEPLRDRARSLAAGNLPARGASERPS